MRFSLRPPRGGRCASASAACLVLAAAIFLGPPAAATRAAEGDLAGDALLAYEAIQRGDEEGLAALVALPETDDWRIVDDLAATGRADVARAVAAAVRTPNAKAIRRYASSPPPEKAKARAALHRALAAATEERWVEASRALEGVATPPESMLGFRLEATRGAVLLELDRGPESGAAYERARGIAERLGRDLEREGDALQRRLDQLAAEEDYRRLATVARALLEADRCVGIPLLTAVAEANLGAIYVRLGLSSGALKHLRRARVDLDEATKNAPPDVQPQLAVALGRVDGLLCRAHAGRGEIPEALESGERAVNRLADLGATSELVEALDALASAHAAYGGFDSAIRLWQRALDSLPSDAPESRLLRIQLRVQIGSAQQEIGSSEEARDLLDDLLRDLTAVRHDATAAVAHVNLGEALEKCGRWDDALVQYGRALELAAKDDVTAAYAHLRMGDALSRRGRSRRASDLDAAARAYGKAEERLGDAAEPTLRFALELGRGEVSLARGTATQATIALDHALDAHARQDELTGGLADGEIVESGTLEDRARLFRLGVRAALATGDVDRVLEMIERSRAKALLASLGGRRTRLDRLASASDAAELRRAEEDLAAKALLHRRAFESRHVKRIRETRRAFVSAQTCLSDVHRHIERSARGASPSPPIRTASVIRDTLDPRTALVLYALLPEGSVAVVITRSKARVVELARSAEVTGACEDLRAELSSPSGSVRYVERAREILLRPLGLPKTVRRILISPDGALAHVPWSWIAGSDLEVSLVPSATALAALDAHRGRTGEHRIALGNPVHAQDAEDGRIRVYAGGRPLRRLPATEAEVAAITGAEDVRLVGPRATKERLVEALASGDRWSAVHLACHCLPHATRPVFSAMVLTPGPGDDGFLTGLEISTMRISADLVTLSACETGLGTVATGEGMLGVTRAFMLAGAPRIIASLWKVDDEATRTLMVRFYEEWSKPGVSTAAALRRAQEATRKEHPSPRHWAGWVLWGLPD